MDYSKVVGGFYVGVRAGLIDEKHYRKMGSAIWLFMWCVHRQTSTHNGRGIVDRGRSITYEQIHAETGFAVGTIRDWMRVLKTQGYVSTKFSGKGVQMWIEGQKKVKVRVLNVQRPRMLDYQHPREKSQHPRPVVATKDSNLKISPKCLNILQDNTTAASQKPLAGIPSIKEVPNLRKSNREIGDRRAVLVAQADQMLRRFAGRSL